ncbi:hypothetical protein ASPTUDRAFT_181367 [Aspergillus tubingensis CBS 134.48]|uniref:EKC/KEOPS complex subunit BUD32 n=1 Tax=Aspergillus tubingensis (strain CBS 134.48) TaxID=767770 RepID=A0A1L9NJI4_ASPTC|nr:hypothetical protein ASPTUDRAFT_181367 [Aspergillus tubingensis CBS 134.48]
MADDNRNQMFWSREFARLVGVLTNAHLLSAAEHRELWAHVYMWKSSLAALIHDLLQPESLLAAEHPQLHEVLSRRYYASMQAREETEISKCTHEVDGEPRTDSYRYQQSIHDKESTIHRQGDEDVYDTYRANICPNLDNDFVLRGILGSGTFGVVFLAHKRSDTRPPEQQKLYAIKVETSSTINTDIRKKIGDPSVAPLYYQQPHQFRYIPMEAYLLLLTAGCRRFSMLDSVYSHGKYKATVMEATVPDEVRKKNYDPYSETKAWIENRLRPFDGVIYLNFREKQTALDEVAVCQIATQLLEATSYLYDMRLCHTDISHLNYLLDDALNTTLIDLGLIHFGLRDADFQKRHTPYIPNYEKFMTPELATELLKPNYDNTDFSKGTVQIPLRHDVRGLTLWQLGCIIYELLHGFAPWEEPNPDPDIGRLSEWPRGRSAAQQAQRMRKIRERRQRVIREELPVSEDLSQDCVDMLRAMFTKDPEERPKLQELLSMPWFGQSSYWVEMDTLEIRRQAASTR